MTSVFISQEMGRASFSKALMAQAACGRRAHDLLSRDERTNGMTRRMEERHIGLKSLLWGHSCVRRENK